MVTTFFLSSDWLHGYTSGNSLRIIYGAGSGIEYSLADFASYAGRTGHDVSEVHAVITQAAWQAGYTSAIDYTTLDALWATGHAQYAAEQHTTTNTLMTFPTINSSTMLTIGGASVVLLVISILYSLWKKHNDNAKKVP